VTKEQLAAKIYRQSQAVLVHEVPGDETTESEYINVVIVEGDAQVGVGVVVSEPEELVGCPVAAGDFVAWEKHMCGGGFGVVVQSMAGGETPMMAGRSAGSMEACGDSLN
jgi:hypothetical protein